MHAAQAVVRAAGLVGTFGDREGPSAVLGHLGHERQVVERPALVQRAEDLLCTPYAHALSGLEVERSGMVSGSHGRPTNATGPPVLSPRGELDASAGLRARKLLRREPYGGLRREREVGCNEAEELPAKACDPALIRPCALEVALEVPEARGCAGALEAKDGDPLLGPSQLSMGATCGGGDAVEHGGLAEEHPTSRPEMAGDVLDHDAGASRMMQGIEDEHSVEALLEGHRIHVSHHELRGGSPAPGPVLGDLDLRGRQAEPERTVTGLRQEERRPAGSTSDVEDRGVGVEAQARQRLAYGRPLHPVLVAPRRAKGLPERV